MKDPFQSPNALPANGMRSFDGTMEIRTEGSSGKLLFKWDPDENAVYIVHRKYLYKILLIKSGDTGAYRIIRYNKDITE